ncbi:BRISC and BRCA1-A complex member 1 [Melipona quadrifasciata]|uniref:BRISC and BRCA1-A complex member 1 n=1 Tax=Melipona quadrifasciata TaxID=166423 RepID=A0A0N0U4H1_9HYME|nr:BRISC and BRCA1-A complex member 1 [Melipona quadrifasciata]
MSNSESASCFIPDFKPDEDNTLLRNFSGMNLPEKILFVIDKARERNCTPFKLSTGASYMPLFMIKRTIENFIYIKSVIQHSHEYGLMILNSHSFQWICDFTNNTNSIVNHLNLINDDFLEEDKKTYDLGQIFDEIEQKLPLPNKKSDTADPTFVVRVILVYSRSNKVGRNAAKLHDSMAKLLAHPLQRPPQKDVCYTICLPSQCSQEPCNNV